MRPSKIVVWTAKGRYNFAVQPDREPPPPPSPLDFGYRPLRGVAVYQRLQAWALSLRHPVYDRLVAEHKRALFGPLRGDVLEIGPGAGVNLPFLDGAVRWIAVEPNRFFHGRLRAQAAAHKRQPDIRLGSAQALPVPDHSVDAVVCSLVLCSVDDPAAALREVRRVLRPGGRFVFIEHVAAPRGTWLRRCQRLLRPLWTFAADGCQPDRETGRAIEEAGFARVELEHVKLAVPIMGPHVVGTAWA
jgi:SAM-dependent methyltransferase